MVSGKVSVFLCIDIGDVNTSDSSRNEGVSGLKVVCGKLRYWNFMNFPGYIYECGLNML